DERQKNRRRVSKLTDEYDNAKFLVPLDVQSDENIAEVMKTTESELGTRPGEAISTKGLIRKCVRPASCPTLRVRR
ncbi:hypothetical protein AB1L30_00810, partial [Bremerella sp. JC817]